MGFGLSTFTNMGEALGDGLASISPFKADPKLDFQPQDRALGDGGQWGNAARNRANMAGNRSAMSSPWEQQQQLLGQALARQMSGQDSLSAMQLRQNADRNISMQQAMAASSSPQNAAMAQRMASQNAGRINQGLAGQQAMAGIMERQAAANSLGQLSGQARGQDMQNFYQNRGSNDAAWQGAMGLGMGAAQSNLGAQMGADQQRLQAAQFNAQRKSGFDKAVGAAAGAAQMYFGMPPTAAAGFNNMYTAPGVNLGQGYGESR